MEDARNKLKRYSSHKRGEKEEKEEQEEEKEGEEGEKEEKLERIRKKWDHCYRNVLHTHPLVRIIL